MKALERISPEEAGVYCAPLKEYIARLGKHDCHSVMVLKDGKVITEAWWKPYRPEYEHMIFSVTKSFVSMAMGFAVQEGLLELESRVKDYFPEYFSCEPCGNMQKVRIKDLLCMTFGHRGHTDGDFYYEADWLSEMLHLYLEYTPGTIFFYDNRCPFLCSAILTKVTGMSLLDYLKPRLFDPLGIKNVSWEMCGKYNIGGWGLKLGTEELALFGQFLLNRGKWNGVQLLSSKWIDVACSKLVENKGVSVFEWPDWEQGYGYYFWQCVPGHVYRADGAFGQFVIVVPDVNMTIAITAGSDMQCKLLEDTWKMLSEIKTADRDISWEELKRYTDNLEIAAPEGSYEVNKALSERYSGVRFHFPENMLKLQEICLHFEEDHDTVEAIIDGTCYRVKSGRGKWIQNDVALLDDGLKWLETVFYKNAALNAAWQDDEYVIKIAYTQTPFVDIMRIHFSDNTIHVELQSRPKMNSRHDRTELIGIM